MVDQKETPQTVVVASLSEKQQQEVIPELDDFTARAKEIAKEIGYMLSRLQLHQDEALCKVAVAANKLVGTLTTVNGSLKQGRANWVKDYITSWHRFRIDDEDESTKAPTYESVTYKSNNEWEIIMVTPTHGRELIVLHACDGIEWTGVYSAKPVHEAQAV